MDLYVQRHGLAGDPDSDEYPNDDDRPLTAKGIRRIGRQVRGLNSLGLSLDAIITSPLVRAVQTADIVHRGLESPGRLSTSEVLAPTADPSRLVDQLLTEYSSASSVMIVGHEPNLSGLVSVLVTGDREPVVRLRKGALCRLQVPALRYGRCGWIEWFLTSKQMAELG